MSNPIFLSLGGGALIGLASTTLLLTHGRIAGVSGIFGGAIQPDVPGRPFRASFLFGLATSGLAARVLFPAAFESLAGSNLALMLASGLLVGVGTQLGTGCTSGHGVCGVSRLSPRSLVATAVFMVTGALSVFAVRHVLGGGGGQG